VHLGLEPHVLAGVMHEEDGDQEPEQGVAHPEGEGLCLSPYTEAK
jgi:hypothetical protein